MNPIHVGALLHSALYLGGCFLAGAVAHNGAAWRLALAAMGVTYLGYLLQIMAERSTRFDGLITPMVGLSNLLGFAAGIALLF